MPKRLLGLLAAAAILLAACQSEAPTPTKALSYPAGPSAATSRAGGTSPGVSAALTSPARTAPVAPSGEGPPAGGSVSGASGAAAGSAGAGSGGSGAGAVGSAEPTGSSGADGPDLTSTSYSFEPPGTRGGTLVVGGLTFPTTINPYAARSPADRQTFRAVSFDGLVTITGDLRYVSDLATGLPLLSNGGVVVRGGAMDVTWELKPGMRWSDGQPITCADLEATWKWNVDPANSGLSAGPAGWRDVGSVEAVSDTICVMHYTRVYEGYLGLVSTLLPRHYLDTVPVAPAGTALYPLTRPVAGVYSGPYVPVEVVDQTRITFVPNPRWATIGGHAPLLDRVVFRLYPSADALVAAYRSGEIQVAMDLGESDISRLGPIPLNEMRRTPALTYAALDFNNSTLKARLGDDWQTVVRAIRLAIDRAAIVADPMGGTVRPTEGFVPPLAWYARAAGPPLAPDPAAARQLLDGAGWQLTADGTRARNGTKLALELCSTHAATDVETAAAVARQLSAIGIMITVVSRPARPDVYGEWDSVSEGTACNAMRGTFDILLRDHTSTVDPLDGYDVYVSDRSPDSPPHDGQNASRVSLPALDAAYRTVRDSVDLAVIRDAMGTAQDIFASDQNTFELPLFTRTEIWLARTSLRNFTPNPSPASGTWNIGDWWIRP